MEEDEIPLPRPRTPHIKKRALKNKALTVSFNEELRDYVTGFHKRKKKRRREAEQQQEEALRRKKRKLEKEAVYGGAVPDADDNEEVEGEEDDEDQSKGSISGTKTYENGNIPVTVTTSVFHQKKISLLAKRGRLLILSLSVRPPRNLK